MVSNFVLTVKSFNFRSHNPNMIGKEDLTTHYSPYQNNIRRNMGAANKKRFFENN